MDIARKEKCEANARTPLPSYTKKQTTVEIKVDKDRIGKNCSNLQQEGLKLTLGGKLPIET